MDFKEIIRLTRICMIRDFMNDINNISFESFCLCMAVKTYVPEYLNNIPNI